MLGGLPGLRRLCLIDIKISDRGMQLLGCSKSIERLFLVNMRASGESFESIARTASLRELVLIDNGLTESEILRVAASCPKTLQSLRIEETGVTEHCIRVLRRKLPSCEIRAIARGVLIQQK